MNEVWWNMDNGAFWIVFFTLAIIFIFVAVRVPRHPHQRLVYEGRKRFQRNDWIGAEKAFSTALERNSKFLLAYFGRSAVYLRQHKYDAALEDANQIIKLSPNLGLGYALRGNVHVLQRHFDAAFEDFDKALTLQMKKQDRANVYSSQGFAFLARYELQKLNSDLNAAETAFGSALRYNPKYVAAYDGKAQVLQLKGNDVAAIHAYADAIRIAPSSSELYIQRGSLHSKQGRVDSAIADCSTAIQLNSQSALAYNNRGYFYSLRGDLDHALADCNKAISLDPSLVYAYGSRGHTYFLMGRYPEALVDFQKALEIKPDHKFALAGEAIAQHALGNLEAAKTRWQALVALDSEYRNPNTLKTEYQCADAFAQAAQAVATL